MSTRSSRRIASRRQEAMGDQGDERASVQPGEHHASAAPEGSRGDSADRGTRTRERHSRPGRRRQPEAQQRGSGQHGQPQEDLLHSSAGHSNPSYHAARALAGLHGDFAGQRNEPGEAAAQPASAEADQRGAGQQKRVPPRSPPKPERPPLPPELLRPQAEGMHGLPSLPAVPPASVPYPSLEALASIAEGIGTSGGGEAVDTDEGDLASQQGKRRAAPDEAEEGLSETEGEGGSGDSRSAGGRSKRPRLVWTAELHARFMNAVNHLGVKDAVPKTILQLMNVEGMTRENVASHLQKYRLYLKRMAGYPPAARLPLDTLQQVQQAIQQQGHPPLFQQNIGGVPSALGIGFPGFLPTSSGMGPSAPQWRPPVMPVASEGPPTSEAGPTMQPFPWLGAPFPGPGGFQPSMGMYGQVPAAFSTTGPEAGAPPGYGWFWGMMGAPNASGGPARHPMQGQTQASGAGKHIAASGPQVAPHMPSHAHASAATKPPKHSSAAGASIGMPAQASHAHQRTSGMPEHKASPPNESHAGAHALRHVPGHSSIEHQPGRTLQAGSQAGPARAPAGRPAHVMPTAGQPGAGLPVHSLPKPTHASIQAHVRQLHAHRPHPEGSALPPVSSMVPPEGRSSQQAGQHAYRLASQVPHHVAAAGARHEEEEKSALAKGEQSQ